MRRVNLHGMAYVKCSNVSYVFTSSRGTFRSEPHEFGLQVGTLASCGLGVSEKPPVRRSPGTHGGGNAAAVNLAALQTLLQAQMQQNASLGLGSNMAAAAAALSQPTSNQ